MTFTFEDMERFATEAWGPLGTNTARKWRVFNERYFAGALKPVPVVFSRTLPFGGMIAFCSYNPGTHGRTITLSVPSAHDVLLADNGVLLHEMVHQLLFERGENAKHQSEGWRREIMRLTLLLSNTPIWAGRSATVRRNGKVVRMNLPNPETGQASLRQKQIAIWPHSLPDVHLGGLGS
jgi:hypothetical protein